MYWRNHSCPMPLAIKPGLPIQWKITIGGQLGLALSQCFMKRASGFAGRGAIMTISWMFSLTFESHLTEDECPKKRNGEL